MRKALIALVVLAIGLTAAWLAFSRQPTYAGVSMPQSDYRQLKQSRSNINDLLAELKAFNYKDDDSLAAVEKAADRIAKDNVTELSRDDAHRLCDTLYGNNGIVTIVRAAHKHHYNIDNSVASRFHGQFEQLVRMSINGISQSSAQRQRISDQFTTDLNLENKLYTIGKQHDS